MFCKPPSLSTSSFSITSHNIYNSLVIALNASTAGSCIPVNELITSTTSDVNSFSLFTFSKFNVFDISDKVVSLFTILRSPILLNLLILSTNFGKAVPVCLKNVFILPASPSFT